MRDYEYNDDKPICPYCLEEIRVEAEDYDCDEFECPKCEKIFKSSVEFTPSFTTWKADCLNGGEHKYDVIHGAPMHYFVDKLRCGDCGKEIKDEDLWQEKAKESKFWKDTEYIK